MKMGKFFYLGVGLCLAGIVLMSLPVKPCVDCDDDDDFVVPKGIVVESADDEAIYIERDGTER